MTTRIRCDAGPAVGLGHVSRCLGLAEALVDEGGAGAAFICADAPPARTLIAEAGFAFQAAAGRGDVSDAAATAAALRPGDLLVLDGYCFAAEFAAQVRGLTGARVLLLDDLHNWSAWPVDWVLAFTAAAVGWQYGGLPAFLGPAYLPVRRRLREKRAHPLPRDPGTCLVALGGWDQQGFLLPAVSAARTCFPRVRVAHVAGLTAEASRELAAQPGVEMLPPLPDLAGELARCGLCLCGGGMAKYECVYLGGPAVVLDQTELQHDDTQCLARRGLLLESGWPPDLAGLGERLARARDQAPELGRAASAAGFGAGLPDLVRRVLKEAAVGDR